MLTMVNDRLDHVQMIFRRSWYSRYEEGQVLLKNFVENGEDQIGKLNRKMNHLRIEEKIWKRR